MDAGGQRRTIEASGYPVSMGSEMRNAQVTPAAAAALALLALPVLSLAADSLDEETIDQVVVVAHKDKRSIRDVAASEAVPGSCRVRRVGARPDPALRCPR